MDTSRISFGEIVAAGSGIALLMFMLFFKWFSASNDPSGTGDRNAWETFTAIDLVLALVAVIAVGIAVARGAGVDLRSLPVKPWLLVAVAGVLACALIVYRLLVTPDLQLQYPGVTESADGGVVDRGIGIYLGLAASAGIVFGGVAAKKERESRRVRRR